MALGITSARCTCEFDASNRCICTVDGRATVDSVGDYVIMRNWWSGGNLYGEVLDTKTVYAGDPTTFNYSGSFDNTRPDASEYDIQLNKSGVGPIGTEKVIYPVECEVPCPDPTVSITEVSDRNPESGEVVNFTGYASGGTGHSIVSRKWDFGDGTSSTLSNPSKSWKNTTGSPKSYTVVFTATNDCGKSGSSSTTITVASEVVKTGIEIQFPASLNGKQLIAHGAISTVLDLWWTGPAVHGGLWTKGRATWDNIDSSKKYHISVGDACKESPPIDGVYPEYPDLCAGTFANGDDVVILVRNPGFDFRVYGSGNVHTLSGTSFNVLYLDETSGDIITTAFTGKVCGWLGIPSGTECDAFWAEFYDPIFVANYMSIASTGNDMFGNPRTLSWIDHVAFVASLVGSLPVFNIFPFAGVVKQTLGAITDIVRKVPTLVGSDLVKAGKALADICENSPDTLLGMSKSELDELRAALVKAYGDLEGNRIIDDALATCRWFVRKYHDILDGFRTGAIGDVPVETINEILDHGKTNSDDILDLMDSFSPDELSGLIGKLQDGTHKHPTGTMFESIGNYRGSVSPSDIPKYVTDSCDIASEAMKAPNPAAAADIPKSAQDYASAGKIVEEVGENVGDEIVFATGEFAGKSHTAWKASGKAWQQAFSKKCWGIWNGLSAFYKEEKLYIMMGLALSFATTVLYGLYRYTADDTSEQATTSLSLALFTKGLDRFYWDCKEASEDGRWVDLEAAIKLYASDIDDAEAALARHETVQKENGTYDDFYECLMSHKFSLNGFRHDLDMATNRGTLRVTSNRNEFYAQLDETGDPVYSWKTKEVIFHHVQVGSHSAFIMKAGYTSCTTPSGTVTAGEITTVHCDLVEEVCVPAVPSITAPDKAKVKEGVRFTGSATTESAITYWHWDFDDGTDSHVQSPSHLFWSTRTYTVKLTVTDDCGTAETTHTIVIEGEAPIPPIPPIIPPEEESGNLLINKPINKVNKIECTRAYNAEIFVDNVKVSSKAPFTIAFGTDEYVSGYGGQCGTHTIKVRLDGYQDVEQSWTINNGDDKSWTPEMYLVGYVPPVDKFPINFYIPEGAVLGEPVKVTTVSRIVAGMRRIGGR